MYTLYTWPLKTKLISNWIVTKLTCIWWILRKMHMATLCTDIDYSRMRLRLLNLVGLLAGITELDNEDNCVNHTENLFALVHREHTKCMHAALWIIKLWISLFTLYFHFRCHLNQCMWQSTSYIHNIHYYRHSACITVLTFLVGTHCSPLDTSQGRKLTDEELEMVNEALEEEFLNKDGDDRFLESIVHEYDDGDQVRCFFPVENSMTEPEKGAGKDEHSAAIIQYQYWCLNISLIVYTVSVVNKHNAVPIQSIVPN